MEYKGFNIKIERDDDAESPNCWGNEDVFLVADHRDFTIRREGFDPREDAKEWEEGYHVFPLIAYIHGGVALSLGDGDYPFTCRWDSGQVGYVLISKSDVWKGCKHTPEEIAESLVVEWNQYLSGDVHGYIVSDADGEELDSCWGFYGEDAAVEVAKECVDHYVEDGKKQELSLLVLFEDGCWEQRDLQVLLSEKTETVIDTLRLALNESKRPVHSIMQQGV